ncbi:MAG: glycine cleavage system protein H [Desulfobacterales bacterium]|nr:glycine cleavage system protein H [Desulfobacterales bacterium]
MTSPAKKKSSRPTVHHTMQDECVWSRAGVIKPIKCMNAFNCLGCSFDKKVRGDFKASQKLSGPTSMDHAPARLRLLVKDLKCRHMLSGRVSYKLCAHGYNCVKCPYDQMIEDIGTLPQPAPPALERVAGFELAQNYYYHQGHAWARVEYGGLVRVGIDDFALRLFGPQDSIELPGLGASVEQNRPHAMLRRDGNEAEASSPVGGKVVAINPKIERRADLANGAPYSDGWLMVIQPTNLRKNLKNLFFGTESLSWIDDEANRLSRMVSEDTGYAMAAAGGEAVRDIYGSLPGLDWNNLAKTFLR